MSKLKQAKGLLNLGGPKAILLKLEDKITKTSKTKEYLYKLQESAETKDYQQILENYYLYQTGEELDLNPPKTFNEKIQWLKLYDSTPEKTRLADKYLVRKWVKEKIGGQYLIPLLGVWDCFEDIDFNMLPDQFVLKCNHGSGWNLIVKDKKQLDIADAKRKFDRWMSLNYAFCTGLELHYSGIIPKIIAEKYMTDESGTELKDYKIFCFSGEPKIIQVDFNRFHGHKRNLYDTGWRFIDASIEYPNDMNHIIPKPAQLNIMLELASRLSEGFSMVRVDFYCIENGIDNHVFFGEMTFTHGSGMEKFSPQSLALKMGDLIKHDQL